MRTKTENTQNASSRITMLILLGLITTLVTVVIAIAVDTDNDGLDDAFEDFFGLDAQDPADAIANNDSDNLINIDEFEIWTDPFEGDTDQDNWPDDMDESPHSRAVIYWGERDFLLEDGYFYPGPDWQLSAEERSGVWLHPHCSEPPFHGWTVDAKKTDDLGRLVIGLDRSLLSSASNLAMTVTFIDHAGGSLYVDLTDGYENILAADLAGNLIAGSDEIVTVTVALPIGLHPTAEKIQLRRGTGEVTVSATVVWVDNDFDGLDADQEEQLGTSDNLADTDGDGLSDPDEFYTYGTDPLSADTDSDGLSDGEEVNEYGTDPLNTDTDGDGYCDQYEVQAGADPLDAGSHPDSEILLTVPNDLIIEYGDSTHPDNTGRAAAIDNAPGEPAVSWSDSDADLSEGLVAHFKFDETNGAIVAVDSSSRGNDGDVDGATAGVLGVVDTAYSFDGIDDMAEIPSCEDINEGIHAKRTVSLWFRAESVTNSVEHVLYAEGGGCRGLVIYLRDGQIFAGGWARIYSGWSGTWISNSVTAGEWHHVALVLDATNTVQPDAFSGYLDGVEFGSTEGCQLWAHTQATFGMAKRTIRFDTHQIDADGCWFSGKIDEAAIWNAALKDEDIELVYSLGLRHLAIDAATDTQAIELVKRVWTATNAVGEKAVGCQFITVEDTTSPVLTLPSDITVQANESIHPTNTGWAAASDLCDPDPEITYSDRDNAFIDGLVMYLPLDEANGASSALDISACDNNAEVNGAALGATGIIGTACEFDGVESYLSVANTPDINLGVHSLRTIALWFKADAITGGTERVLYEEGGQTCGMNIYIRDSRIYAGGWDWTESGSGWDGSWLSASNIAAGTWHHVALTLDGTETLQADALKMYIDGNVVGSAPGARLYNHADATGIGAVKHHSRFDSGEEYEGYGRSFDGLLDDFALWNRTLGPNEIGELYADGAQGFGVFPAGTTNDPLIITRTWTATDFSGNSVAAGQQITLANADQDADSDGFSDLIEYMLGTDPNNADTDGDGLSDYDEVAVYYTDPFNADTDGDDIGDKWEVENGTNPLAYDAMEDPDGDGLSNIGEYWANTDPSNADTDGDGVSDDVEIRTAYTDPLAADFDGTEQTLLTVDGSSATENRFGDWRTSGASIYCVSSKGWLEYELNVPANGFYALKTTFTQHDNISSEIAMHCALQVDGISAGYCDVPVVRGASTAKKFFLPRLESGLHTFRLEWLYSGIGNGSLEIVSLELVDVGGPDADSNGQADWLDNRLARLGAVTEPPDSAFISPVCYEGASANMELLSLECDGEGTALRHGVGDNWYVDCPLSPSNSTALIVSGEAGIVAVSEVEWTEWNLFGGLTNAVLVRTGDSLLLNASPPGATNAATIEIASVTNYTVDVGAPAAHEFDSPGEYTVTGTCGGQTAQLVVTAVSSAFGTDPICMINQTRQWACPQIADAAVVEYDPALRCVSSERDGGGLDFALTARDTRPRYMVARLGEDGPVTDNARVKGTRYDTTAFYEAKVVGHFSDGSELVEFTICMDEVPADLEIKLHVFVGGVTFDDGTLNRTLTAADFDEYGWYTYRMIRAPERGGKAACHTTTFYQDGTEIGDAKAAGENP